MGYLTDRSLSRMNSGPCLILPFFVIAQFSRHLTDIFQRVASSLRVKNSPRILLRVVSKLEFSVGIADPFYCGEMLYRVCGTIFCGPISGQITRQIPNRNLVNSILETAAARKIHYDRVSLFPVWIQGGWFVGRDQNGHGPNRRIDYNLTERDATILETLVAKKKMAKNPVQLPENQSDWADHIKGIDPAKASHKKHLTIATLVEIQIRIKADPAARAGYKAAVEAARSEGATRKKTFSNGIVHIYAPHLEGAAKSRAVSILKIAGKQGLTAKAVLKYLNKYGEDAFLKNQGEPPPPKVKPLSKKEVEKARDGWIKQKGWLGEVSLPKAPRKKAGPVLVFAHQDGKGQVQVLDAVKVDSNLFLKLLRAHSKRLKAPEEAKPKAAAKPKPKSPTPSPKKDGLSLRGLEHLQGQKPKG